MAGFGDGTTGNGDSGGTTRTNRRKGDQGPTTTSNNWSKVSDAIRSNKMSKMKTNTTSERSPKLAFKSTRMLNFKSSSESLLELEKREAEIERIRNYIPPVFEKERRENNFIMKILLANVLFQDLPKPTLDKIVSAFEIVSFAEGDEIFTQGDLNADFMIILKEGQCSVTIDGKKIPDPYGTVSVGSMLGEDSLLRDKPRAATITADTEIIAFSLDHDSFKHFMDHASYLQQDEQDKEEKKDITEELRQIDAVINIVSGITSRYKGRIIKRYKPSRRWLYFRLKGTILEESWKVVVANMLVALGVVLLFRYLGDPQWVSFFFLSLSFFVVVFLYRVD